jgi:hypothetical protein
MFDEQMSSARRIAETKVPFPPMMAASSRLEAGSPRLFPREEEMPSKLRRSSVALKAKAYRSAVTLAGVLVLLEALGAPRKL